MAIKEKYSLRFSKIRNNNNSIFYSCDGNTNIEGLDMQTKIGVLVKLHFYN